MASVLKEPQYRQAQPFMVTEGYPQTDDAIAEYLAYYEGMDPEVSAPFNFEGLGLPWEAKAWREFLRKFHTALNEFSPLCVPSYAFGNHDQHRLVTRLGEDVAPSAAVLLLTLPGMSFIYNGDELGMKNGEIPPSLVQDPGAQGGDGRDPERTPLQWTPGPNAGFTTAKTPWLPVADNYQTHNVETESSDPGSFLSLYRRLAMLRNQSEALRYGTIKILETKNPAVLAFNRIYDDEVLTTLVNFSAKPQATTGVAGDLLISSHPDNGKTDSLAPHEARVYKAKLS
jgi:alpha-glucosidase